MKIPTCPGCGAALAGRSGLCPACLLRQGLTTDDAGAPLAGRADAERPDDQGETSGGLGGWQVLNALGESADSSSYVATARGASQLVVLTTGKPRLDSESRRLLVERRRPLVDLHHPDLPRIFELNVTEAGQAYLVQAFVRGRALADHCARARVDLAGRLLLLARVADALQTLHERQLPHGHVCASTIRVSRQPHTVSLSVGDLALSSLCAPSAHIPTHIRSDIDALRGLVVDIAAPEILPSAVSEPTAAQLAGLLRRAARSANAPDPHGR